MVWYKQLVFKIWKSVVTVVYSLWLWWTKFLSLIALSQMIQITIMTQLWKWDKQFLSVGIIWTWSHCVGDRFDFSSVLMRRWSVTSWNHELKSASERAQLSVFHHYEGFCNYPGLNSFDVQYQCFNSEQWNLQRW